jgi:O-methyltransferase involved in polyketide biosynthesis
VTPSSRPLPSGIDITVPNVARMYDYYLGGKDNFEADRVAADQVLRLVPAVQAAAFANRRFLRSAVRYLAETAGIDQFLDLGVGLPTQGAVHEIAHQVNPGARVVYVDIDPVVVLHANVLLSAGDKSVAVQGDFRAPGDILADPAVRGHLDFGRPVAVLLLGLLHFVSDADDPAGAIAVVRDHLAPGSYVTVSTVVRGRVSDRKAATEVVKVYDHANARLYPRSEEELEAMFAGFELLDLPAALADQPPAPDAPNLGWSCIARRP